MQASGFGVVIKVSGPDTNYGLGQCYEDLSFPDCELCYAEARTAIPPCYPYYSSCIYLDGCFMRYENYSFFQEYTGPGDRAECRNTTRRNPTFKESMIEALNRVIVATPHQKGHSTAQEVVLRAVNESAYVLVDCWMTLSASSCRACMENASALILECFIGQRGEQYTPAAS
nr:cysteine-rich receptor-like protein kinase 2 [Quercus suber]